MVDFIEKQSKEIHKEKNRGKNLLKSMFEVFNHYWYLYYVDLELGDTIYLNINNQKCKIYSWSWHNVSILYKKFLFSKYKTIYYCGYEPYKSDKKCNVDNIEIKEYNYSLVHRIMKAAIKIIQTKLDKYLTNLKDENNIREYHMEDYNEEKLWLIDYLKAFESL
jgi:hypothetical protein